MKHSKLQLQVRKIVDLTDVDLTDVDHQPTDVKNQPTDVENLPTGAQPLQGVHESCQAEARLRAKRQN